MAGPPTDAISAPRSRVWTAPAFCHVPADGPVELDRLAEPGSASDRWNDPGIPTVYLASDAGVALAEFARHHAPDAAAERRLLSLRLGTLELADLTDEGSRAAVGVGGAEAFLDRTVARGIARALRRDRRWAGLLVPSMAFLDDPTRCNLVVFPERLLDGIGGRVEGCEEIGRLVVERPPHSPRTRGG